MLKVIPKTWSYSFSVTDGANAIAQSVDLSWWRDKGELRTQDAIYTARRDRSSYVLESADGIVVRAERPRKLFRQFLIKHAGRQYTLRAKSALRREFRLLEGSAEIGSIAPQGLFTRKAAVDLPRDASPVSAGFHHLAGDDALEARGSRGDDGIDIFKKVCERPQKEGD